MLTLLCQHSGRGSCAAVAEAWHQCRGLSHQESTVKSLPADQTLSKGICLSEIFQLNTFHGWLSVIWTECVKQQKAFLVLKFLHLPQLFSAYEICPLCTVTATVLWIRTSKPEDNNNRVCAAEMRRRQGETDRQKTKKTWEEKRRREGGERRRTCETVDRQMIWPLSRHDDSGMMAQLELIRIINWRNVLPPWCVGRFHAIGSTSDYVRACPDSEIK